MGLTRLRIFISSPGDVAEERAVANRLVRRLSDEFAARIWIEPVFWEHEPLLATDTFQNQIPRPSESQVVICILWSRLGTRLPASLTRPDGTRYASGTEYEFEDAVEGRRKNGYPDLLVYRKTADPLVSLKDITTLMDRVSQKESLDAFIKRWFFDDVDGTLKAAFHSFEKSSEFEQLVEEHLRKLIGWAVEKLPAAPEATPVQPAWTAGSPFRGLDVFEFEHAPVFFGRSRAIGDVLNALRRNAAEGRAFVLIVGVSGGGKSSLVRAGVLPLLTQPGVIEGVGLWRRAVLKPADAGGDPFRSLAASLFAPQALPELGSDGTTLDQLTALLRDNPAAIFPLIKGGLSQAACTLARERNLSQQPDARLVLVADQLEELFTLQNLTSQDRSAFAVALSCLARSGKVFVIATLRGDYYHRFFELSELVALKEGSGQYDLPMPTPAEMAQMIREPARSAGLRFEEEPQTKVTLDEALREAAGEDPASLPLLEFALEELYQRKTPQGLLTYAAYRDLGGVEGSLTQRAEAVYGALPAEVRATLPQVMRALVSIGEGNAVARRVASIESAAQTPEAKAFVEAFIGARLFTADRADATRSAVRVTHEALLRNWPRVKQWLEQDRQLLLARGRVSVAAARWELGARRVDLLLGKGTPLEEARSLLADPAPGLSSTEIAFVRASMARARRGRRRRDLIAASIVLLAVASAVASLAAWRGERRRREGETRLKQIALQTAASRQVLDELHLTQLLAQDLRANTWAFMYTRSERDRDLTYHIHDKIQDRIHRLLDLTADDPELKPRINSLGDLCGRLNYECQSLFAERSAAGEGRNAIQGIALTDPSERTLAGIQRVAAEIEAAEDAKVKRLAGPSDDKAAATAPEKGP